MLRERSDTFHLLHLTIFIKVGAFQLSDYLLSTYAVVSFIVVIMCILYDISEDITKISFNTAD